MKASRDDDDDDDDDDNVQRNATQRNATQRITSQRHNTNAPGVVHVGGLEKAARLVMPLHAQREGLVADLVAANAVLQRELDGTAELLLVLAHGLGVLAPLGLGDVVHALQAQLLEARHDFFLDGLQEHAGARGGLEDVRQLGARQLQLSELVDVPANITIKIKIIIIIIIIIISPSS